MVADIKTIKIKVTNEKVVVYGLNIAEKGYDGFGNHSHNIDPPE